MTLIESFRAVMLDNDDALNRLSARIPPCLNDPMTASALLKLMATEEPRTVAALVETLRRAAVMTRANVLTALQLTLEHRGDLMNATRRTIVEALIDATLDGNGVASAALLAYVQTTSEARTDFHMMIATYSARMRKSRELREITEAADPRHHGGAL